MLSMSTLLDLRREGLVVTDSTEGIQFNTTWSKEETFACISQHLPFATELLAKREDDDSKRHPSILLCTRFGRYIRLAGITIPDGNNVFQLTQKPGKGFRGSILILSVYMM